MDNGAKPLVSIIIPAYNVERYIAKGLDSCINQTYDNIEVVITDDGSCDNTWEIIQVYSARDKRVISLHQENQGVSAARNKSLNCASGEYVLFLDSDDWLEQDAVEVLLNNHTDEDTLVCSDCYFAAIDENSDNIKRVSQVNGHTEETCSNLTAMSYVGRRSKFRLTSSCYKLFSRGILEKNQLRFKPGIHQGEDGLFTFQYLCNVKSVKYISIPLWNILDRPGSACNVEYNLRWKTALEAVALMIQYKNDIPSNCKESLYAFMAERAMWLETSSIRSKSFDYDDYLLYKSILRSNRKYLIKRERKLKTVIQCFVYTSLPVKWLRIFMNYMKK